MIQCEWRCSLCVHFAQQIKAKNFSIVVNARRGFMQICIIYIIAESRIGEETFKHHIGLQWMRSPFFVLQFTIFCSYIRICAIAAYRFWFHSIYLRMFGLPRISKKLKFSNHLMRWQNRKINSLNRKSNRSWCGLMR